MNEEYNEKIELRHKLEIEKIKIILKKYLINSINL